MCHKCQSEANADPLPVVSAPTLPPFHFPEEQEERSFERSEVSETCIGRIRDAIEVWRTYAGQSGADYVPTLEWLIDHLARHIYGPTAFLVDRMPEGVYLLPEHRGDVPYGDTEEKQQANVERRAKQILRAITDHFGSAIFDAGKFSELSPSGIAKTVGNKLRDSKGQTIPKRIAKLCHSYGWKLTKEQIETIGNIVSKDCESTSLNTMLAFDQDFNDDGADALDYCHDSSCWFENGEYSDSRPTLYHAGGYGVRCFDSDGDPISRCWIAPLGERKAIIFNPYGNHSLTDFADLLSPMWSTKWKPISITRKTKNMYINGDKAILLCDTAEVEPDTLVWLPKYHKNESRETCCNCNTNIDQKDDYNHEGDWYCSSCFHDRFFYCERCCEYCSNDDQSGVTDRSLCEYCANREGYHQCSDCDEWHQDCTDVNASSRYTWVCVDCLGNNWQDCHECGEWHTVDSGEVSHHEESDGYYCSACMPDDETEAEEKAEAEETAEAETVEYACPVSGMVFPVLLPSSTLPESNTDGLTIPAWDSRPVQRHVILNLVDRIERRGVASIVCNPIAVDVHSLMLSGY